MRHALIVAHYRHYTMQITTKQVLWGLLLSSNFLFAQFEGYTSFKNDTSLIRKIKKADIKSAVEKTMRGTEVLQNKTYVFNTSGRISDLYETVGATKTHKSYSYNTRGQVVSEIEFGSADSNQIVASENNMYTDKGQLLHSEKLLLTEGVLGIESIIESRVVLSSATKTIVESDEFFRGNKTASYKLIDSIVGKTKFAITYRYKENDVDNKGRIHGKKNVVRTYVLNGTEYEDNIEYEVYGSSESSKDISTKYYVRDAKKRLLEHGTIDYEAVYADFLQRHPDNFNPYQISGLFVEAVLKNQVMGTKRPDAKFIYNAKGQLLEKTWYGSKYKYSYDAKGNIISFSIEGDGIDNGLIKNTLSYNEKGLVTKLVSDVLSGSGSNVKKETTVTELTYYK